MVVADLAVKSLESFAASVRANVRGLWRGVYDDGEFVDGMYSTLLRGYTQAWNEGAALCGVTPADRTDAEQLELVRMIETDIGFAPGFAGDIETTDREEGGKLGPFLTRAELWVNGYNRVRSKAQQLACADQKLEWVWDPAKEHCSSCEALNGRVHRASVWASFNIQPQSRFLACGGWRCGCEFRMTNKPATRGRPPILARGL